MRSLGHWVHFLSIFAGLKRSRTAARMGNISESSPASHDKRLLHGFGGETLACGFGSVTWPRDWSTSTRVRVEPVWLKGDWLVGCWCEVFPLRGCGVCPLRGACGLVTRGGSPAIACCRRVECQGVVLKILGLGLISRPGEAQRSGGERWGGV